MLRWTGKKLKFFREKSGLSQETLACRIIGERDADYISQFEDVPPGALPEVKRHRLEPYEILRDGKKRHPTFEELFQLADALGVKLHHIGEGSSALAKRIG